MIWSHFRKKIYERINVKHGNFKNVNRTLEQLARALKKKAAQIIRGDAKVLNCVRIIFCYRIQPLKYIVSNFCWPQINRLESITFKNSKILSSL